MCAEVCRFVAYRRLYWTTRPKMESPERFELSKTGLERQRPSIRTSETLKIGPSGRSCTFTLLRAPALEAGVSAVPTTDGFKFGGHSRFCPGPQPCKGCVLLLHYRPT